MNEEDRFRKAFWEELNANPKRPPGPAAIRRRMGLTTGKNLNGRLSPLRITLLHQAGFKKDGFKNRWYKP